MRFRAALVWATIAVALTFNGMLRELLYRAWFGFLPSQAMGSAIAILIVAAITRLFVQAHPDPPHRFWVRVGVAWGLLTIAFEFLLGRWVTGLSWTTMLSNYNVFAGRLWPLVLLAVFLAPPFWSRRLYRRRSVRADFRA